ncbi:MAG: winged helix-turn-helix domain-containing protein [Phycicoccus sp.]
MDVDRLQYLRAAADPARMDLFDQLKAEGRPLSTAELARIVPEARGGIQAHLGALAEGGWIEHLGGKGRAAMWQARRVPISLSGDDGGDPAVARALDDLSWIALQRRINRIRRFDAERQTGEWSPAWVEAHISRDYSLWLTAIDLDELDDALAEVFERFKERSAERKQAAGERVSKDTELVFVTTSAFPVRRGS